MAENKKKKMAQNTVLPERKDRDIDWRGSSYDDLMDEGTFPIDARKEAGHQLGRVQAGLDPDTWKSFDDVGAGTKEIIIDLRDGWYRVMYVSKFEECIYVLHCFKKKTNTTTKHDKSIAEARYKAVVQERLAQERERKRRR